MYIVLVRREARCRRFRLISAWVLWTLLGSVLYGFVVPRPVARKPLSKLPKSLSTWCGCGGGQSLWVPLRLRVKG